MRRGHIVQVVLFGLLFGAIAGVVAYFVQWLPTSASVQANRIWDLYWVETIISIVIFAVVMAALVVAVIHFRARPDDEEDGPPTHGNTTLEVVWTAIPTVIVVVLAVLASVVLVKNGNAGNNPLHVDVQAEQFAWTFCYPERGEGVCSGEMHLPVNRTVQLNLTSRDVIHSFWVPNMAQKQDTVPGDPKTLVITPTREGAFPVVCTELCGLGHGTMRARVVVQSEAAYKQWLDALQAAAKKGS